MHTQLPTCKPPPTPLPEAPLRLSDYQFDLPPDLIAQTPADARDAARLLVVDREAGYKVHTRVRDLEQFLRPGDLLVVNDTRVLPARIHARTVQGSAVELLFVHQLEEDPPTTWLCLGKPARRLRPGATLSLPGGRRAQVAGNQAPGQYAIRMEPGTDVPRFLVQEGEIPLPPYIRRPAGTLPLDRDRYQTIFADCPGAVAAPTAGLHFTRALIEDLAGRGVRTVSLTLHVGPGTFLPVRHEAVHLHEMQAEWARIPAATAEAIQSTRQHGGRVLAVGTTTTRALESAAVQEAWDGRPFWADRFITPGYRFRVIDGLFTNFHLPGSTLLFLVAALLGHEELLDVYRQAITAQYRFYSYGDAMLIL